MKVLTENIKTIGGNPHAEWYQNRHQTQDRIVEPGRRVGQRIQRLPDMGLSRDTFYRYQKAIETIVRDHIGAYVEHEQDRGMSLSTVNTKLRAIYAFLQFL